MTNADYAAGRAAFLNMKDGASKKVEGVKKELGEKAEEVKKELGEKWDEIFGKKD
jgi:tryptophanyl-tRNA synthetase